MRLKRISSTRRKNSLVSGNTRRARLMIKEIGEAKLYLGDCLGILPIIKNIDAVVTDPPYGLNKNYNCFEDTERNVIELGRLWLPIAREISERVVFTSGVLGQWFYPKPDWVMAWVYKATGNRGKWGFSNWQPILCYGSDPYLKAGKGARMDILECTLGGIAKIPHPCPKPLEFIRRIIERVTISGTVLDPFMGSGTTGVAALNLGRKFIGIEKDPEYFEIACKRIEQAEQQGDLLYPRRENPKQLNMDL